MPRIIARSNPVVFKNQAIRVEASPECLRYTPVGSPMSFADMLTLRQPITVKDPESFTITAANLGVSVNLCLTIDDRELYVLVRQDRPDRGDNVLKLLSGYVPAHELRVPLLTAMTEIAEELLLEGNAGWLQGRYQDTWLPTPYAAELPVDDKHSFILSPHRGHTRPVYCGDLQLQERPRAYVHLPTNSLQLVYHLNIELPRGMPLSALHADERLDQDGQLTASLDPENPDLLLVEQREPIESSRLYTLEKGKLVEQDPAGVDLSEALAPQQGWVIDSQRTQWPEGLLQI